jgi:hypothetical protein
VAVEVAEEAVTEAAEAVTVEVVEVTVEAVEECGAPGVPTLGRARILRAGISVANTSLAIAEPTLGRRE